MKDIFARVINKKSALYGDIVKVEDQGHRFGIHVRLLTKEGIWFEEKELKIIKEEEYSFTKEDIMLLDYLFHVILYRSRTNNTLENETISKIIQMAKEEIKNKFDEESISFEILVFNIGYPLDFYKEIMKKNNQ